MKDSKKITIEELTGYELGEIQGVKEVNSFDWKEEDEAFKWAHAQEMKGLKVLEVEDHCDTYTLFSIDKNKVKAFLEKLKRKKDVKLFFKKDKK